MKAYAIIFVDRETSEIAWARICSAFPVAGNLKYSQLCIGRVEGPDGTDLHVLDRKLRMSLTRQHPWLKAKFRARMRE